MLRIKNFFTGSVIFEVADLPISCLNRLRQYQIKNIQNDNGVVSFTVPLVHAPTVKKLVNNFDWQTQENYNIFRGINFLLNHFVLCIAVIIAVIGFCVLDMAVYDVQINSPDATLNQEVNNYLQTVGIKKHTWKKQITKQDLANDLVSNFPTVAHANVRIAGNTLVVTLATAVNNPPKVKTNIYAKHNAVVRHVIAYSGTVLVTAGDVVRTGDLLVQDAYADSIAIIGEVAYVFNDQTVRLNVSII